LHLRNSPLRGLPQIPLAIHLEALRVEADAVMLFRLKVENLRRKMLDCMKQLSMARRQQASIGSAQLDRHLWAAALIRRHKILDIQTDAPDQEVQKVRDRLRR
jgi:hypothetical protein